MRRLDFNQLGGHPFKLDDLRFVDGKINEVMTALASHGYMCILSGCVLSQDGGTGTWHNTAGYVILLGEIYEVPAGDTGLANGTEPTANTYYSVQETVAAPSPTTYKNLTVKNVHYTRKAVLGTAPTFAPYNEVPTYEEVMADKLPINVLAARMIDVWVPITTFQGGWASGSAQARVTKDAFGRVQLSGDFSTNSYTTGTDDALLVLPAGYRPTQTEKFYLGGSDNLTILANGAVGFNRPGATAAVIVSFLSSVSFLNW